LARRKSIVIATPPEGNRRPASAERWKWFAGAGCGKLFNTAPVREARVFRPWRSFPTMVATGLVVGFATGGFPSYSREISQLALALGMTFALTEISFAGISPRLEFRRFILALAMSYGVLSGLILIFAVLSPDAPIHDGWVLMASVPPAIAVVPITSYLKGDTRPAVISLAILYLGGLVLVPLLTFAFTQQTVPLVDLVVQTVLLIGLPILASRPLRRSARIVDHRTTGVSISFFFLVIAVAGSTRNPLLERLELLLPLSLLSFARTFGIGAAVFVLGRALRLPHDVRVALITFASFKNLGLTVVLAFAVFGAVATLPSIVSLVFEILWLGALPLLFRTRNGARSPTR
jgi:BASS family bile acid:Na+ symporter